MVQKMRAIQATQGAPLQGLPKVVPITTAIYLQGRYLIKRIDAYRRWTTIAPGRSIACLTVHFHTSFDFYSTPSLQWST